MSNITLFSGNQNLPAFYKKGELSPLAKALAGSGGGGKRISIKGGVFRLMVDGKEVAALEERYLDTVIVAATPKIGRTYYMTVFNPDSPAAPDCWSADGERPDATAATPQAKTCADCPQNVKGSGQGESKACRYSQRLAVVLASDIEGDVMQLQIPATSIFGNEEGDNRPLQAYARFLAAQSVSPEMVVTRIKFDTKAESPKLFFKAMRWLTEEEFEIAREQGTTPDAIKAITMTVAAVDKVTEPAAPAAMKLNGDRPGAAQPPAAATQPRPAPAKAAAAVAKPAAASDDDEPPAPPPAKRGRPSKEMIAAREAAAAAAAKAAAMEAEEGEGEEAEPEVRKPVAAVQPAAKSSLAKLAQQWDDE